MRRHDKLKNIHKANILNEQRYLESKGFINEELITEIETYPYKLNTYNDVNGAYNDRFIAEFNADGLRYNAVLECKQGNSNFGEYEVSFSVDTQKHTSERQGRDLKHLNNVLYTVLEITEDLVKRYKIKKIKFEGAIDDKDDDSFDTLRSRLYNRLVDREYPSEAIRKIGRYTYIDMSKVFPDIIESGNEKADLLIDLLLDISDENKDEEYFRRTLSGLNDNLFTLYPDTVENSELGLISFEIDVNVLWKEYSVKYEIGETGEEDRANFNNFNDLYDFIYDRFVSYDRNNQSEEPIDDDDDDDDEPKYDRFTLDEFNLIKNSFNNFGSKMSDMSDSEYNDTKFLTQNGSIEIYRIKNKNGENLKFNFLIYKKNNLYYIKINTFGLKDEPYYYNEESFRNINELVGFINKLNSHY